MAINPHRKGGPDVPVTDGGTGASVAATALSNLGGIDTSAHALIDHTGLPGVGGGVSGVTVIEAGSTGVQIQSALNNAANRIVYVKPGTYSGFNGNGGFTIPQGKKLIGLGGLDRNNAIQGSTSGTDVIFAINVFQGSGSTARFTVNAGAVMANILINGSGLSASSGLTGPMVNVLAGGMVENCAVINWNHALVSGAAFQGTGATFRNCYVYASRGVGFFSQNTDFTRATHVLECAVRNGNTHGFQVGTGAVYDNCSAWDNDGDGFRSNSPGGDDCRWINCVSRSNNGDGFNILQGNDGTVLSSCWADGNGAFGFRLGGAVGTRPALVGSGGRANASGNFSFGAGWNNLANWNG